MFLYSILYSIIMFLYSILYSIIMFLYIFLFQPHRNDRSCFTTASSDVRCHIGRSQSSNNGGTSITKPGPATKNLTNSGTNNSIR